MIRAFLSHSSKDKDDFVRRIATELGRDNIIYDEFTFENGAATLEEIVKGINNSVLFVLFLSDNALNSEWVKKEITMTKNKLDEDTRRKVFPVIIDSKITHNDSRIPEWLKSSFNLRPIMRTSIISRMIKTKLRELSWDIHPHLKKRNTIFVGRNDVLEKFEARMHDFDKEKPIAIIASGLPGVGRRTFLHQALIKTNITESSNRPAPILLDRNVSIEDFILKINDLGLIDIATDISDLTNQRITDKISIIHKILNAAYDLKEIIYIIDDGCLINYQRSLSDWFKQTIDTFRSKNFPILCISSKYRIKERPRGSSYFFIDLPELNPNERRRLLNQLLDMNKTTISKEQFNDISDILHGYPDQIMYAADIIRDDPAIKIDDKMVLIREYSTDKASVILKNHELSQEKMDFIRLLAQFEVITREFIYLIIPHSECHALIDELSAEHIIELIGIDGDIIRLNDIIRDYIKRNRLLLNRDYSEKIDLNIKNIIASDNVFEYNSSEIIFSLKEALKNNTHVNQNLLIPSHYLRCMKDLYHNNGNLDKLIELADIILQRKANLASGIIQDIQYYLCLALAKKKNSRMLEEVQKIQGNEHNFLLGFYYRLNGRLKDALEQFSKIVYAPYVGDRAKREIVQVYVQLEEYDKALLFAKENYMQNRGNQFHTQAYFNCLINSELQRDSQEILWQLIENLQAINSEQSKEMSLIAEALYIIRFYNEKTTALDKLNDCCSINPRSHYPLLAICDLAIKFKDKKLLNDLLEKFSDFRGRISTKTINKYTAYSLAFEGKIDESIAIINEDLSRYTPESKSRIIDKLKSLDISTKIDSNDE